MSKQYDIKFFDQSDYICTWGNFQKEYDESRDNKNLNIVVTGHPRFDLYKSQWRDYFASEIEEKKLKYGDFILLNGNYGISDHVLRSFLRFWRGCKPEC